MYCAVEVRSVIQFYTVQNHSATEIHKKFCAVYDRLMHCGPYFAYNFSYYLYRTIVSYSVKLYYASKFYSTVHLNCMLHVCVLVSCDILYHSIWHFYSVSSNSKLILPLIWFHSVYLWLHTNLGKLTFETTLVFVFIL